MLWSQDFAPAILDWPHRAIKAKEMWETLNVNFENQFGKHILDVACGPGVKSFVLAQLDPKTRITAVDFPKVLEVIKRVAKTMGVLEQVTFIQGDILNMVY